MAVKKPVRRKRTRGRKFAGVAKVLRSRKWTPTLGIAVAVAFVALVAVLMMVFRASPPPTPSANANGTAYVEERATTPRPTTAAAAKPKADPAAVAPVEESDVAADGVTTGPMPTVVTLTGCLARSDKEFRLNDTTGLNAPKARSWKSGFLAKRSASVSIVPASGELPLSKHVGHRVTVSGTLIDREMRVRTLRRVSSSCEDEAPARITA
jgi:hypothetical protein